MALSEALMQNLLDAISGVVNAEGPYKEKREQILEYCTQDEETDLIEFTSWFEGTEEGEEVNNQA
jgi:hypothetical protein